MEAQTPVVISGVRKKLLAYMRMEYLNSSNDLKDYTAGDHAIRNHSFINHWEDGVKVGCSTVFRIHREVELRRRRNGGSCGAMVNK